MKKSIFYYAISLLLAVILFSSCSSSSESEGEEKKLTGVNLIPDGAFCVVELNTDKTISLLEKSQRDEIVKDFEVYLDEIPVPGIKKKVKEILNNPQALGIKTSEPIYLSAKIKNNSHEEDPFVYITGSLSNVESFKSVVNTFTGISSKEYEGINYFEVEELFVFYSQDAFLATIRDYPETPDAVKKRVGGIFKQDKYFSGTGLYNLMAAQQGLLKVGIDVTPLTNSRNFKEELNLSYEEYDIVKGSKVSFALNMYDGGASFKCNVTSTSPKFNEYVKNTTSTMGQIKGEHLEYIDKDEAFVAFANINGEKYMSLVKELFKDKFSDEEIYMLDLILPTFNGDITFKASTSKLFGRDKIPAMALYASTKDNSIVSLGATAGGFDSYANNVWVNKTIVPSANVYIGYDGKTSYATLGDNSNSLKKSNSSFDAEKIKGKSFYASLNVGTAINDIKRSGYIDYRDKDVVKGLSILENIDCVEISSTNFVGDCEIKLSMKDKTKNLVEVAVEEILPILEEKLLRNSYSYDYDDYDYSSEYNDYESDYDDYSYDDLYFEGDTLLIY